MNRQREKSDRHQSSGCVIQLNSSCMHAVECAKSGNKSAAAKEFKVDVNPMMMFHLQSLIKKQMPSRQL